MTEADRKRLFDAIREVKGTALTQRDVNLINDALVEQPTHRPSHKISASQAAIDLIHSFEQFRAEAYKDPGSANGLPITIGWGSTRNADGSPIRLGDVWTREQADAQFRRDLEATEAEVRRAIQNAPTSQGQFDAMVSFEYNTGKLAESTLIKKHRAGDNAGAKAEFAKWVFNDGKRMRGLERRRREEAELYAS